MKRTLVALAMLQASCELHAQAVPLPAWIGASFAPESVEPVTAAGTETPAHRNAFIGSYSLALTIRHDGISQTLHVSTWQDSTRGIVQVELVRGMPHTTYFADLEANVAVIANAIDRKAVVGPLDRVVNVDRLRKPGENRRFAPLTTYATGRDRVIAGIPAKEHHLVETGDTMHLWIADMTPSPFVDGPAWIPLNEGPLQTCRLLFKFGDRVVLHFTLPPLLELEVKEMAIGARPAPRIDLRHYELDRCALPAVIGKP